MKIFDCFLFFDEDIQLDIRLNVLDQYIDQFVIVESRFSHSGERRNPIFDIRKYQKFEGRKKYKIERKKKISFKKASKY